MRSCNTRREESKAEEHTFKQANTAFSLAKQYDAKIDALHDEIRRLREARNADCSATRNLPSEILSSIFQSLAAARTYHRPPVSWISVTHVCRMWRQIALDEPKLWANVVDLPERWLRVFLDRARTAPLEVQYFGDDPSQHSDPSFSLAKGKVLAILESLFHSPERLGKLELICRDREVVHRLNQPAPNLTALSIRGLRLVTIPPNFLGNSAPCLQSFSLSMASISLGASWLRNLRRLRLDDRWDLTDSTGQMVPINMSSFLEFLRSLERLEDLSVSLAYFNWVADLEYTAPLVRLPLLRKVYFDFSVATRTARLSSLFDHIQFPAIHNLHVTGPLNASIPVLLMDNVYKFFVENTGHSFQRLTSIWDPLRLTRYDVGLSTGQGGPTLSSRSSEPDLPYANLSTIEELEVRGACLLLNLLEASPTVTVHYPSIKQLEIHAKDLDSKTIPALLRWLKTRNSLNKAIERLIISGSGNFAEEDIASLEKLVQVTWIR